MDPAPAPASPVDLGSLGEFRAYLTVLARGQIPVSMQARLDASDLVQETLLEAYQKRDQFRGGQDPGQIAGWLRQILSCNLIDAFRAQTREQRDVRREFALQQALEQSSMRLEELLIAHDSTPSQKLDRKFLAGRVAKLLETLPKDQRNAILMRYCQDLTLEDIAEKMQKTKLAVAGLLKRGLATLRATSVERSN